MPPPDPEAEPDAHAIVWPGPTVFGHTVDAAELDTYLAVPDISEWAATSIPEVNVALFAVMEAAYEAGQLLQTIRV